MDKVCLRQFWFFSCFNKHGISIRKERDKFMSINSVGFTPNVVVRNNKSATRPAFSGEPAPIDSKDSEKKGFILQEFRKWSKIVSEYWDYLF